MNIHSRLVLLGCLLTSSVVGAEASSTLAALSERDFLGEMPVVLSVSRLAQRLDETPGAVTILDRNFIRLSGARDVADLLRVVPGFQSFTSYETDAPMAVYHGRIDDWANRIQVLVDGRSVYSGFIVGSAGLGWQTIAMDDVERIEVFRGSNSATYGARAFLGVVNIVSVAPMDALGAVGSVTAGSNGVADASARVGWGSPDASYRISMDTHGDDGLRGTVGRHRTHRVNFAGAWSLGAGEGLELRAGALNIDAGRGAREYGEWGNPARMRYMGSRFLQMDWSKSWSESQDIAVSVSRTEYLHRDSFPYYNPEPFFAPYFGISIGFDGIEVNNAISFQQTTRVSPALRTVWGSELRQEFIDSPNSFDTKKSVRSNFYRLFANAEWRISPKLLLNAGLLAEQGDLGGESVSPRIMLNWDVAAGSTLRAGFSDGFRPPSAFEKYGSVKYYDMQGKNPLTYVAASGKINSETIRAIELGYHANFPQWNISGDARLFHESIRDGIYCSPVIPSDCWNQDNYLTRGLEYQWVWKPGAATQFFWTQSWASVSGLDIVVPFPSDIYAHNARVAFAVPAHAGSLALMHTFDSGLRLSVVHHRVGSLELNSQETSGQLSSMWRTDLRLAKAFRWAGTPAEIALTLQNVDAPYQDSGKSFYFDPRAFLSLRLGL